MKTSKSKLTTRFSLILSLSLIVLLSTFASSAMACGYGLYDVTPGENTFADALKSNGYLERKISTHTEYRHTNKGMKAFTYKTVEFTDLGVTVVSEEVKGEEFNRSLKRTDIAALQVSNLYSAVMYMRKHRELISKIQYKEQSPALVESNLGAATAKSYNSLEYSNLGLRFEFSSSDRSAKMDHISMIEWRPKGKTTKA